jgi:flagellar biosynthetic protein FliQ
MHVSSGAAAAKILGSFAGCQPRGSLASLLHSLAAGALMEPADIVNITREGIWVLMVVSGPMMVTAMLVGLAVSLIQALTQIQETTLTFVPKMVSMLLVMVMALPYMLQTLQDYGNELFERIATIP